MEAPKPEVPHQVAVEGNIVRMKIAKSNDFQQAGERYRALPKDWQDRLVENIAHELKMVQPQIAARAICNFARADAEFGMRLAAAVGIPMPDAVPAGD